MQLLVTNVKQYTYNLFQGTVSHTTQHTILYPLPLDLYTLNFSGIDYLQQW